jgi:L-aminoadipate-semialdehyde dehydrogenase
MVNTTPEKAISRVLSSLNLGTRNPGAYLGDPEIGDKGWSTARGRVFTSINPATGQAIASVHGCTAKDYARLVEASTATFRRWRLYPAPKRGEVIRQIADILREHKDALGSLVALETGKIKQEGDGEVQEMIDIADFAVGQSRMLYGRTMPSERPEHRMLEQWHPLGIVGTITAFNFPVAVWSWNAFISAICGNTVIWKPSATAPLCAVAVQQLCNRVTARFGFPGLFTYFLPSQHRAAEAFVRDRRIALISFTGSSRVGHFVAAEVAQRLGKYLLECSGNNAIIVDESADLDLAVPAIVFGAVGTAGQRCTTTRRLIVHDSIFDSLVERLVHAYGQVRIGDPLDPDVLMGPLIDAAAKKACLAAIKRAQAEGGTVLYGGAGIHKPGYFVQPTLVAMPGQTGVVREETFAPILYLLRYDNLEQAIALHNDVPQGLSSAIFTNTLQHAEQFMAAQGSDCGLANVNIGTSGAEIGGAFGGEKETGGGRESGSDAWKAYMRRQTNTINWGSELPLAQGIKFDL